MLSYFLIFLYFKIINKISFKTSNKLREKIKQRFICANFDVIKDLNEEEENLMKTTFENTVKNA